MDSQKTGMMEWYSVSTSPSVQASDSSNESVDITQRTVSSRLNPLSSRLSVAVKKMANSFSALGPVDKDAVYVDVDKDKSTFEERWRLLVAIAGSTEDNVELWNAHVYPDNPDQE